jgi:phage-related protein
MSRFPVPDEKPLHWISSSKRDLLEMPSAIVHEIGIALSVAQFSGRHSNAKPWKGLGSGVLEYACERDGNAFRAVYVTRFERALYVLHCFQKKSPRGRRTARPDIALIAQRLQAAQIDYEVRYGEAKE